ncbi:unnamed protein product [Microthlaspi erraticum]|uniref:Peptidase S1 domain-containing protein n=1 Tax=Microthlaspi erraticum TaxID=1685480 RepID=A0A6D2I5W2_9BRAS|nr:unnamed protein product [Microthlaspi erraticum]
MLSLSVRRSVRNVARLCNSSSIPVSRFLSSSPSLGLRSLALTTRNYSSGVSSYHASTISHYSSSYSSSSSSSSAVLQSDSAQEKTRSLPFHEGIHSVVQIFELRSGPKPREPWNSTREEKKCLGCGLVISGRGILTDSHTVTGVHSWLRVRKYGSPTFYTAKVESVVRECTLATLVVDSEEFWENMQPLELGDEIPSVGETVSVYGYENDAVTITEVTVTSLEPREYYHGTAQLLAVQDMSWYNSGPVVIGNKIVGFYPGVDEIIPTSVIKQFLNCPEDAQHIGGFGSLDICHQTMEDAQLRRHFKMSPDMTGVLITKIDPLSNARKVLKEHDLTCN